MCHLLFLLIGIADLLIITDDDSINENYAENCKEMIIQDTNGDGLATYTYIN